MEYCGNMESQKTMEIEYCKDKGGLSCIIEVIRSVKLKHSLGILEKWNGLKSTPFELKNYRGVWLIVKTNETVSPIQKIVSKIIAF